MSTRREVLHCSDQKQVGPELSFVEQYPDRVALMTIDPGSEFPDIVGRVSQRRTLRGLLENLQNNRGGVALISGEAGIGKTTLISELARLARSQHIPVLTGHCYDQTAMPPYDPWVEMLRAYAPEQAWPPVPGTLQRFEAIRHLGSREALYLEARDFFESVAWETPLILVVEDLHWVDPGSLDLLRFLSRTLRKSRILTLITYRDEEIGRLHPFYEMLPHLIRESGATRITLQNLDEAEIYQLVDTQFTLSGDDRNRLAGYLQVRSGGNPFFIVELLRSLREEGLLQQKGNCWALDRVRDLHVPPLIRQVINLRLSRLDTESRQLLDVAAVIGQEIPLELWSQTSKYEAGSFAEAIEQLIDAGLISEMRTNYGFRFSHALLQETVYESLILPRRQRMHLTLAETLLNEPNAEPAIVASHLQRADDIRAVEWLIAAAGQAEAVFSPQSVILHIDDAQQMAQKHGIPLNPEALLLRGKSYQKVGEFDRALVDYEAALQLAEVSGDQRFTWETLLQIGELWTHRDMRKTGDYSRQALELARQLDDKQLIGRSLNLLGNWQINAAPDGADTGFQLHEQALTYFQEVGDQEGIARSYDHIGIAAFFKGDVATAQRAYGKAVPLLREIGDRAALMTTLAQISSAQTNSQTSSVLAAFIPTSGAELNRQTDQMLDEALEIAQETGSRPAEAFCLMQKAAVRGSQGDYRIALESGLQALEIARAVDHAEWIAGCLSRLGHIYLDLLAYEEARDCLEEALTNVTASGFAFWRINISTALSAVYIAQGAIPKAAELVEQMEILERPPNNLINRYGWLAVARLRRATGNPDEALEIVDRLIDSEYSGRGDQIPVLQLLRAENLIELSRFSQATASLTAARSVATELERRPLLWRIDAASFSIHRALGEVRSAEHASTSALACIETLADELDDPALQQQFLNRASARLPGVTPFSASRLRPENYAGLTNRELEVLQLVSQGLTDAQVSEQLFISPRTVSQHLRSVYNKLNVNNRVAASRIAVEQGIA